MPAADLTPFASGYGFLEAPRWRDDQLWVSDIASRRVICLDSHGTELMSFATPGRPSGIGWLPNGDMIVVMMDERRVLRWRDGWVVHIAVGNLATADINDMVVAASGNAYITGLGYSDGEERRPTRIILVRPDGTATCVGGDVWRPNGCVVSPDQRRLVVAETRLHRLTEFTIQADGSLIAQRVVAELPSGSWVDGICLDVADGIWGADPKGKRCFRVSATGEITHVIDTAPIPCIACTLGGSDGRSLFLLLSDLGDMNELHTRAAAQIIVTRVDIPGAGSP